jgi:hypothetical protein
MRLTPGMTDPDREIEKDAIAIYQVADDLYMHNRYRLDGAPPPRPTTTNTATATNMAGINEAMATNTATGTNAADVSTNAAASENP